eukprot:6788922-Lingulodinium_polyedra.AAC.1
MLGRAVINWQRASQRPATQVCRELALSGVRRDPVDVGAEDGDSDEERPRLPDMGYTRLGGLQEVRAPALPRRGGR